MERKYTTSDVFVFLLCLVSILVLVQQTECKIGGKNSTKPSTGDGHQIINVVVLLPFDTEFDYSRVKVAPAIRLAINSPRVRSLIGNSADMTIVKEFDSQCSQVQALKFSIDSLRLEEEVDVFFGPVCSYAAANMIRLMSHWNKVMMSAGTPASGLDNNLVTRVFITATTLGQVIADVIFNTFQWNTTAVISADREGQEALSFCYELTLGYIEQIPGGLPKQRSQTIWRTDSTEVIKEKLSSTVIPNARKEMQTGSLDSARSYRQFVSGAPLKDYLARQLEYLKGWLLISGREHL